MANIVLYDHTKTDAADLPRKITRTFVLVIDQSQIVVRRVSDTGQVWPRGASVRPYSTE
jgi:hypothetical protein